MDAVVISRHVERGEDLLPPRRMLSVSEVAKRIPFSQSWIRRAHEFDPTFPDRIRVGKHRLLFYEDEVDEWLARVFERGGKCPAVGGKKRREQTEGDHPITLRKPRAKFY